MNDLKIGDKVRFKKLSEKEFKNIYYKIHNELNMTYYEYIKLYNNENYFNKIFEIRYIEDNNVYMIGEYDKFYLKELEKIDHLKTKFKIIKELFKNE